MHRILELVLSSKAQDAFNFHQYLDRTLYIIPVGFCLDSVCNNAVLLWNRNLRWHGLSRQYEAASPYSVLSKYWWKLKASWAFDERTSSRIRCIWLGPYMNIKKTLDIYQAQWHNSLTTTEVCIMCLVDILARKFRLARLLWNDRSQMEDAESYPQLTEKPSCFPWGLSLSFWNWNNHQVRSIQNIGKLR
jgi:hypothetical protein